MKTNKSNKKATASIIFLLVMLSTASFICLLLPLREEGGYAADIYQNGTLIMSIPLNEVRETRIFTITGESGCTNQVEVRPGCIAIIAADCPDKLCVNQGFLRDSRLPITCLPNRVVIQLRPVSKDGSPEPDIVTH